MVDTSGQCTTNSNGQCDFAYTGPSLPGADLITAYADSDSDIVRSRLGGGRDLRPGRLRPRRRASASGGGDIEVGGNRIVFGFSARSGGNGFQGSRTSRPGGRRDGPLYGRDRARDQRQRGEVFGNATVDGVESPHYRLDGVDNADPGRGADIFSIQTGTGYSRSGTLTGGNVQIHRRAFIRGSC